MAWLQLSSSAGSANPGVLLWGYWCLCPLQVLCGRPHILPPPLPLCTGMSPWSVSSSVATQPHVPPQRAPVNLPVTVLELIRVQEPSVLGREGLPVRKRGRRGGDLRPRASQAPRGSALPEPALLWVDFWTRLQCGRARTRAGRVKKIGSSRGQSGSSGWNAWPGDH